LNWAIKRLFEESKRTDRLAMCRAPVPSFDLVSVISLHSPFEQSVSQIHPLSFFNEYTRVKKKRPSFFDYFALSQ
jgi:hypothetical protein